MGILSKADWLSLFLGSIALPAGLYIFRFLATWWRDTRPIRKLLDGFCIDTEPCKIFVRDLILEENSKVLAIEPRIGIGVVPNIRNLYAEVEGKSIAYIFNVLGQVGKKQNIELIGMGEDTRGEWNSNVILLGAQAQKHFDFYRYMKKVAYKMDADHIYNCQTNEVIQREVGYGYGIILKAENPFKTSRGRGIAFLIGGFGVLGTLAAAYYFRENVKLLGKEFGKNCFGIVVRAPVTAGEEAVDRLRNLDILFDSKRGLFWPLKKKQKIGTEIMQESSMDLSDNHPGAIESITTSGYQDLDEPGIIRAPLFDQTNYGGSTGMAKPLEPVAKIISRPKTKSNGRKRNSIS